MFIPVPIRRRILKYLFANGVLVVSSNHSAEHEALECLNVSVFQIGRSVTDRGLCTERAGFGHLPSHRTAPAESSFRSEYLGSRVRK